MNIEDKIFQRYSPDFNQLEKYGFIKQNNSFVFEKMFQDGLFKAVVVVNTNEQITATVYDIENL